MPENLSGVVKMWKQYALLAALFAALTAIFSKLGSRGADAGAVTAVRVSFVLVLVWGIALWGKGFASIRELDLPAWIWLFFSAISTGLSWFFYFKALEEGDVSRVAPLDKLSVPITILLAFLLLGEAITWKTALGGILITLGAIIIAV